MVLEKGFDEVAGSLEEVDRQRASPTDGGRGPGRDSVV